MTTEELIVPALVKYLDGLNRGVYGHSVGWTKVFLARFLPERVERAEFLALAQILVDFSHHHRCCGVWATVGGCPVHLPGEYLDFIEN